MDRLNIADIPWNVWASPKGKFRSSFKELSIALGAVANAPVGAGGHPFDVVLERLAPGESSCPYHEHAAQWEPFYILSGHGTVRSSGEQHDVTNGDVIMHPPGDAHQITNTGSDELLYLLIADNPALDVCHYPDSNKVGIFSASARELFRATEVDYWNGEE